MLAKRVMAWMVTVVLMAGMCPSAAFADDLQAGETPAPAVAVTVASAKSSSPGQLTVKAGGAASAYQFQVATNAAFTANLVSVDSTVGAYTFKKLKKGSTYYVRVRGKASSDTDWDGWSASVTARVQNDGTWKMSGGYATYVKPNGKLAHGLTTIKGKTYLFSGKGRQKTGWQKHKGAYRFFKVGTKSKAYMVKGKVVNGIKLDKTGKAKYGSVGAAELKIMVKAQKLVEKTTKPSQSKKKKLQLGFDWMLNNCKEEMIHQFGSYKGWHRTFANEIYDLHNGSCFSYGAAFAYYANAIGYKSCKIVSSGGHGWAEIGGDVYDIEWTRHHSNRYFAWPYSKSGVSGAPDYASSRIYVVKIAPKTSRW